MVPRRAVHAEEAAEVEVLNANLSKMKSVSKKIQASMSRLEQSGRNVQEAIGPVYGNTQRLQIQNANIDRILAAIEKVTQPLDLKDREERILRNRIDRVGLQEYIGSIDRTNQALQNLQQTNLRSNQQAMAELGSLLEIGTGSLEGEFRDVIRRDADPIEPLKQITTGSNYPRISSSRSGQLRMVHAHITTYAGPSTPAGELLPSAKAYAHERGQYIMLSLQNLSTACRSTARKVDANAIYRQGSNGIGAYAQGILGMFIAEYDNVCHIFNREEWSAVLQATCQSALQAFSSTLQALEVHIRENMLTDCYLAYEIIEVVSTTSINLESKTGELKHAMSDALKPIRETAKSSLSLLLNTTKQQVQQLQTLPQDGNSIPLTTETMVRLQLMTSYLSPLSSIMRSLGDGNWKAMPSSAANSTTSIPTLKSFDVGADGKQLFAHYASDVIETLLNALSSRSLTLLRGKSLQAVFLANNVTIITRMIAASDLNDLVAPSVGPKVELWRKRSTTTYLEAWREPSAHLLDVQFTAKAPRPPSTGAPIDSSAILKALNSKDKDGIKEKFRSFNTSFDELVQKHKSYRMEPEVRRALGENVRATIEPLYGRFWERYHEVDKGRQKYVKYDKSQMGQVLVGLSG
ncbi:hypothetical protein LTR62_006883 [Meristemomyces frigidus]|uniref:Exocyst complex protein EXO70 n=1 Tax=Meristemomyces frigidus TaxID=1508187 RepID=A0AAN7TDN7_9PEZI|nr:hypothetical protein LTR62_006883 [Meristemomyces frigidus]